MRAASGIDVCGLVFAVGYGGKQAQSLISGLSRTRFVPDFAPL
jgi:hypothetical protein